MKSGLDFRSIWGFFSVCISGAFNIHSTQTSEIGNSTNPSFDANRKIGTDLESIQPSTLPVESNFADRHVNDLSQNKSYLYHFIRNRTDKFCSIQFPPALPYTAILVDTTSVLIQCFVDESRIWFFDDFIRLVDEVDEFIHLDFGLKIKCTKDGIIDMAWPTRCKNLKFLSVQSCVLVNSTKHMFNPEIDLISDTIEYFQMSDTRERLSISDLKNKIQKYTQTTTRTDYCGPENARVYINQNKTFEFDGIEDTGLLFEPQTKDYLVNRSTSLSRTFHCQYRQLKDYDVSRTMNLDPFHFEELVQYKFPVLEVLNFSTCQLTTFPQDLLRWRFHFPRLNILDLSSNFISQLPQIVDYGIVYQKSKELGLIDLRYNNISFISSRSLKLYQRSMNTEYSSSFRLDIHHNPFVCDCIASDFVHYIQQIARSNSSHWLDSLIEFKDLLCSSSSSLPGRHIYTITDTDMGCEAYFRFIQIEPMVILVVLVTMLVIMIIVIIKYRTEITILAFTRFHVVLSCQHRDSLKNKEYDAFVAYSEKDTEWVIHNLVKKLETDKTATGETFHLCLHHRDFGVGTPIAINIINSIESSRHTILVISDHFLRSEWCLMEFRTAFHQTLLEKKNHLIMILLEDITRSEIDSDLKRCMKMLTYVKTEDALFWDKLIYALSTKRAPSHQKQNKNENKNADHTVLNHPALQLK